MIDQIVLDRLERIERMLEQLVHRKLDLEPEPRVRVGEMASDNEILQIICSDNPQQAIREREKAIRANLKRARGNFSRTANRA